MNKYEAMRRRQTKREGEREGEGGKRTDESVVSSRERIDVGEGKVKHTSNNFLTIELSLLIFSLKALCALNSGSFITCVSI